MGLTCGAMGECDEKFIFECDVHGVECGHDVECVPRCGAVERFDVKCDVMSAYVKCGPM